MICKHRIKNYIRKALFYISMIPLLCMVGALFFQVIAREFRLYVDWTEELSRFSFISMVFFAAAYSTLHNGHLRVSFLSDMISNRYGSKPLRVVQSVILMGFTAVVAWFSLLNLLDGMRYPNISPAIGFNQNLLFIAMFIGFVLILLYHIIDVYTILFGAGDNHD